MAQQLHFYRDLTQIAENRIKELMRNVEVMDARKNAFPKADSYFQACAVSVYLAWRNVTQGWHTEDDLERLEALTNGTAWAD